MVKIIKQDGFTLLELTLIIIITGIIVSMSFQVLYQAIDGYFTAVNTTDANWQAQISMQTMGRSIKSIRSPNDILVATANTLTFVNINNNTLHFSLNGNSIVQTRNNNAQVLADGISSLRFDYFDKTGVSTNTPANIAYIRITINVTQKNTNFSVISAIFPSNF